jgi:hypothetical protein
MKDRKTEALDMLYRAKWNVPTAAKHCGLSENEMREVFRLYCDLNEKTYHIPPLQLSLLGNEPTIM